MSTNIPQYYERNGNTYVQRSAQDAEQALLLATIASTAVMGALPYFSKPFTKQLKKEIVNNDSYRDAFVKSFEKSGLKEKGVTISDTRFSPSDISAIRSGNGKAVTDSAIKAGENACYVPGLKNIKLNLDRAAVSGFHEAGHAMNHLQSKLGKLLQHSRNVGIGIAGLMGTMALFTRKKAKGEKRNPIDFIQDNCGKIAFASILPVVAEEALASRNGIKLARLGGLKEPLVKNLKKVYGKALLSYIGYAIVTGLSVFSAGKIMDIFTRPKLVETLERY